MKVILFGGSGFLGSHLVDVLLGDGYEVVIYDRSTSKYHPDICIEGDILDRESVAKAVKGCDIVYNFAAMADIEQASLNPIKTAESNIMGNLNVLEAARHEKVKRFVFSSSVYVYSDAGSFYRCSKQASELFIENYQKEYGLDYTILRYGSLYGPRADDNNWIYRILKQALSEKKMVREGDGNEIREYIHVLDAARVSVDILQEKYKNQCFIISGHEQMRIRDLLIMVKEILKGDVDIQYITSEVNHHYEITPYVFSPKIAKKIHRNEHCDLGQGIIQLLHEIYEKKNCEIKL